MNEKLYTHQQLTLVRELCETHGLDPSQISFDGEDLTPIFDYEAVCLLSLKLTDIQSIDCWICSRGGENETSTAKCTVVLPDGRSRTCEDSAFLLERLSNGKMLETTRLADSMAQNRAVRRAIRSVGINLYNAHRKFMETGQLAEGHTRHDPRNTMYNEIHVLAQSLDLIVDADKTAYRQFIAECFDGHESAKDLNDIDLRRLLVSLRAMAGRRRAIHKAA